MTAPEEIMARAFGYLENSKDKQMTEFNFYILKNFMFAHFSEQIPEFKKTNQSFKSFIPNLFYSYNSEKEIQRWNELKAKDSSISASSLNSQKINKDYLRVHLGV